MRKISLAVGMFVVILFIGCSSLESLKPSRLSDLDVLSSSENRRVYNANYDTTFRAAVDALRQTNSGSAKLVKRNSGIIIFKTADDAETLTANVKKLDEQSTQVEISAKTNRKYWVDETDKKARDAFFMEMDKLLKPSLSAQTGSEKTSETKVVAEQDQSHQETKSAGVRDALIAKLKQELGLKDEDVFLEKLADGDLQKLDERIQSSDAVAGERKELSMKCANCYVDMARLFHDGGQYERAADALKIAIATDPQNAVAHCNMGEIYKHLRLFDDAIRELNEAKRLNPDLPDTYINMGIIYDDHLGDDKKALEYYQKYLELGGTDKQVLEWIKNIEKGL